MVSYIIPFSSFNFLLFFYRERLVVYMFNMNKKTQKTIAGIIVIALVITMVLVPILSYLI